MKKLPICLSFALFSYKVECYLRTKMVGSFQDRKLLFPGKMTSSNYAFLLFGS